MSNLLRRQDGVFSEQTLVQDEQRINISMKAAHHSLRGQTSSGPETRLKSRPGSITAALSLHQKTTMHCGYLFLLFLGLWAELAAGRALSKDETSTDPDMQSIIEDLQAALQNYTSVLKETSSLRDLPVLPCTDIAADLDQSSTLASRLTQYQVCVEPLRSFCPDVSALCRVIMLNQDLLQHLIGSYQDSAGCPTSVPSSSFATSDFDSMRKSVQCVHCWSQQVEALRK